jgi:large subunit ribosomal protein L7Ae
MSGRSSQKAKAVKVVSPRFQSAPKNLRVGGDIRPTRDLSRYVRWPRYVRIQRQKKILLERIKMPPALNQFKTTLDKNQASVLIKLLKKYQPENKAAKKERLEKEATAKAAGESPAKTAPVVLKFGLKHVTTLIEQKKASLVVIAHDVNPVELVVWLPALCRKMNVPFCIIKGRSRVGQLCNMKNAAVVALTKVNDEDKAALKTIQDNCIAQYTGKAIVRKWGGGKMGLKTQAMLDKRAAALAEDERKKSVATGL